MNQEIKAFKCPNCGKVIEIKDGSEEYVTICMVVGENEKTPIIDLTEKQRVCIKCLNQIIYDITHTEEFREMDRSIYTPYDGESNPMP